MFSIDMNSDLGESFGMYKLGMDEEVLKHITSANIACGFHAGDPIIMDKTIALALENGVALGAHPSYPDFMGFGRRKMDITPMEAKNYIIYQVGALSAFAHAHGATLQHVKVHGALYNVAAKDLTLAKAICEGVAAVDPNLCIFGLAGSQWVTAGKETGVKVLSEIFGDRAYMDDGSLVPRSQPGAVLHDKDIAITRAIEMIKTHKVTSINGKEVDIEPDTICVHGDNPSAVAFVQEMRTAFEAAGITVKNFCSK